MTSSQIQYFNSLSEEEQHILEVTALKATSASLYDLNELVRLRQKTTQAKIKVCLEKAFEQGLLEKGNYSTGNREFKASIPFMIYIYPQLADYAEEWNIIQRGSSVGYYFNRDSYRQIRAFLYSLLHDQERYAKAEQALLLVMDPNMAYALSAVFDNPAYEPLLVQMSVPLLSYLIGARSKEQVANLEPVSTMDVLSNKVKRLVSPKSSQQLPTFVIHTYLHQGNFDAIAREQLPDIVALEIKGIEMLTKGDGAGALGYFSKMVKALRVENKGALLPNRILPAFYYMVALLNTEPEQSMPLFQKMIKRFEKNEDIFANLVFAPIVYNAINAMDRKAKALLALDELIDVERDRFSALLGTCSYFLSDAKPPERLLPLIRHTIEKAISAQYYILSLEAAYAYQSWDQSEAAAKLFDSVQRQLSYTPVLASISSQADWEKSLNALLSLGMEKSAGAIANKEGGVRVVYYVNFKNGFVQPVLQTAQKSGWSKGRNVALKSFYEGKTKGMTEQDYRIAKTIKRYGGGYYSEERFEFTENTLKELVGHPYLFLNGSDDVPVELIEARPLIQVVKTPKGYQLTTDVKSVAEPVILQKETNTRYKIYNLTSQQIQILQIVLNQKILIPESGKEKLIQLLGGFSTHMDVHSDLLADKTERTHIREVKSDDRIRVQLLPLGTGLKAELFSKPFGAHPPYCKPGKGGKVLIANEQGEQLQVKRNLKQEAEYANSIMDDIQSLESLTISDDLIAFDDPMDSLHLLDILTAHQDKCVVEWPEGVRYKIRGTATFDNLNLRLKSGTNWFELQGELKVDETTVVTLQQLLAMTEAGHDRFIELNKGEFLALSKELKKQLDELRAFAVSDKNGVQLNKFASVSMGDFFDQVEHLKADKAWNEFRNKLDNVRVVDYKVPHSLQAELRPYQEEGFRWMARLAEWEGGACLADDMGLGKTIQTLCILLHRALVGPALVICPVSVVGNWIKEAERFAPTLRMKTLGSGNREQTLQSLEAGDVLVTSYGLIQSEEKLFSEQTYATVVLDEAHTIKNYATKTSKSTMQLKASFRVALTGTPLQNHLGEIWNLFNFVNPGLLGTLSHFSDMFIKPTDEGARKRLKKLITPFILRRTKSAVLDELPPKTEIIKKIQLSNEEAAFYEALRRKAIQTIEADDSKAGAKHLQVMAEITKLRQASCNPLLVDPNTHIGSSKLAAFLDIVDDLMENKHRALVFSQFVTHLTVVRAALDKKKIKYQYLDGSMSISQREKGVKKFQTGEGDLFLISLKAGGLGLNLTAADYVIHLDPWWNPAIEDQASDRAHRIGQSRPVTIYRLVAENTIEEKIIQLHNTKRDLAESLLEGSDQSARMSINELISLIRTS